jgi:prolyl-tRNA synthetase
MKTISDVSQFLGVTPEKTIKTLAYRTDSGTLVLALVRGDHEVNEIKLLNKVGCIQLDMANEEAITSALGSQAGYIGPVGLDDKENIIIVADATVMNMNNAVCGANKLDAHYINVNPGRDFKPAMVADLRLIQANDPCPHCGAPVKTARGIEVGQVFKLFTKYSKALEAVFIDVDGKEKPMVMGCYGVGVSRTMAAAIEQNYDQNGIIWPAPIAPFQVVVIPVSSKDEQQMALAEKTYMELNANGIEAVLDDRNERPGVKFKDADLIGYPIKITIGPKAISENQIEVKVRRTGEMLLFGQEEYLSNVKELLTKL